MGSSLKNQVFYNPLWYKSNTSVKIYRSIDFNNNRSLRALQTAEKMKQDAAKDRHPYGMYACIRAMAKIYYSRLQFQMANECNMQALDYMLKELPD